MRRIAVGLAVLAAIAPAAVAQEAEPLRLEGVYLFNSAARQDGMAVCIESWDFRPDGVMLVRSGQERVRKRYRTEADEDGHWIVAETLETNGAPDCMGHRSEGVTPGEHRIYLVPMNDGTIQTCPPPQRLASGSPYISGCYGKIVLGSEAG